MKKYFYTLLLLPLLFCCGKDEKLVFDQKEFTNDDCELCPQIHIQIPYAVDQRKISETVNNALREEVIALLSFEEASSVIDIPAALDSFNKGYSDLRKSFPDENIPWEASVEAEITFENKELLTIGFNSYIFTGGAHGYGSTRYLNFEKESGRELERNDLFTNPSNFLDFAESRFRKQENIPPDQSINSTGLMFELDEFYLPENIGFTEDGLKLLYNPYEVASYADGTIEMTLPYEDVKEFLTVGL